MITERYLQCKNIMRNILNEQKDKNTNNKGNIINSKN